MKKIITLAFTALFALTSNAQLKVDSLGRIKMGSNPASSGNTYNTTIGASRNGALFIHNSNKADAQYGVSVTMTSSATSPTGISSQITAQGASVVHGVKGITTGGSGYNTYKSIGVLGAADIDPNSIFSAGIVGSATGPFNYPGSGNYAGYFYGDVIATGSFLGTLLSPGIIMSQGDGTLSTNGRDGNGMQVTEKLQSVDLLQVRRVNQNGSMAANKKIEGNNVEFVNADGETTENEHNKEPIQTRLSDVCYGLAADQLKEVYPELVYEDKEGNYSINYIEMVPLLVQGIKELSAKVAELEEQLDVQNGKKSAQKAKRQTTSMGETDMEVVSMSQNRPNPFKDKSVITLTVPSDARQAAINIYDMSGKQVQTIPVSERGRTNITVYARHLQPGMFIYSLLVDGKVQATRKMMVTE